MRFLPCFYNNLSGSSLRCRGKLSAHFLASGHPRNTPGKITRRGGRPGKNEHMR